MRRSTNMSSLSKTGLLLMVLLFVFTTDELWCQRTLTLTECYDSATTLNILSGEKQIYTDISSFKDRNISSGWLPAIDFNGSFVYNSDVPDLSAILGALPVPGLGNALQPLPNDQYKMTIEINQVIYDGGAIRNSRELEKTSMQLNIKQTEADLYKLRTQINTCFFGIVLLERQRELLDNFLILIDRRLISVKSAVLNGVLTPSDENILLSERITLLQQISEIRIRKNSFMNVLASLTGIDITETDRLLLPEYTSFTAGEFNRPELQLLDLKKEQLAAGEKMIRSKRMPKAFGFATLGYGNPPGTNFFQDTFDTYYIIGAGIKWNIFDWNASKNEKQVISLQKKLIDSRKEDLKENIGRQLEIKRSEIENLEKLLETDRELADLRKSITRSAESQYENGVITSTEYLSILNSEKQVLINSEIHNVNLALAKAEYYNISGTDIE